MSAETEYSGGGTPLLGDVVQRVRATKLASVGRVVEGREPGVPVFGMGKKYGRRTWPHVNVEWETGGLHGLKTACRLDDLRLVRRADGGTA